MFITFIAHLLGAFGATLAAIYYFNKKVYGAASPTPNVTVQSGPPNEPPRRDDQA